MEPRKIRSFPSRRGAFRSHDVWLSPDGSLSCTCPAGERGIRCWAVQKVAGEMEVDRILGIKKKEVPSFDMAARCIAVAREGLKAWANKQKPLKLEDIKAAWVETKKLHEVSKKSYNECVWKAYYAQFIPENQNG